MLSGCSAHTTEGEQLSPPPSSAWGRGHQRSGQWPLDQSQAAEGLCGAARPPHDGPAGPGAHHVWPGAQREPHRHPTDRLHRPGRLLRRRECHRSRFHFHPSIFIPAYSSAQGHGGLPEPIPAIIEQLIFPFFCPVVLTFHPPFDLLRPDLPRGIHGAGSRCRGSVLRPVQCLQSRHSFDQLQPQGCAGVQREQAPTVLSVHPQGETRHSGCQVKTCWGPHLPWTLIWLINIVQLCSFVQNWKSCSGEWKARI